MPTLDADQIASFFALETVQSAKRQIDARESGSVYFTVAMTETLKAILQESFGLNLPATKSKSVPMRWIKGDTPDHVDVGPKKEAFDTTYLLYLTDSPGELILAGESHPITKGTAYTFPESLHHETVNTGSEPRLLLGPMSEEGFAVGIAPVPEPTVQPCCARPTFRRGPIIDNTTYTALVAGNTYIASVRRNGVNISYAQIMARKKAEASKH